MKEYERYLEVSLNLQGIKFIKRDDNKFYFNGKNEREQVKVVVNQMGIAYINNRRVANVKLKDPFLNLLDK